MKKGNAGATNMVFRRSPKRREKRGQFEGREGFKELEGEERRRKNYSFRERLRRNH